MLISQMFCEGARVCAAWKLEEVVMSNWSSCLFDVRCEWVSVSVVIVTELNKWSGIIESSNKNALRENYKKSKIPSFYPSVRYEGD